MNIVENYFEYIYSVFVFLDYIYNYIDKKTNNSTNYQLIYHIFY